MRLLRRSALPIMAMFLVPIASASSQTVTEWSAEGRVSLSFRVSEAALQRVLPPGWTSVPSTAQANRGGNLNVIFIERQLVLDGQGQPHRSGTSRYVVLVAPARNGVGEVNNVVVNGLSPEGPGAYGTYLTAVVSKVARSSTAQAEESGRAKEHWEFAAASGERVELQLVYRRAPPVKSHVELTLRSARHPEITRTYKVDQAADVLRSASASDRVDALTFRVSGPTLAPLFDGQEVLLSVTSFPWYVREVVVP